MGFVSGSPLDFFSPCAYAGQSQEIFIHNIETFIQSSKTLDQKPHKSKLLLNSVVMSNFSYCPLIWSFCSKVANNEINRTHKCALRALYRDYESTFEELLDRGVTKTTHKKNLQNLMVEIYKSMNHLNPTCLCHGISLSRKMFPTTFGLRNYASSPR